MYKETKDYLGELKEEFNNISIKDLKRIIDFGWRMFYSYTLYGCDINIKNNKDFFIYCGNLTNDSLRHFNYYRNKLRRKLRAVSKRNKIEWNNCYYINLSEKEYEDFIKSRKNKKNFTYENKLCFKLLDEAKLFFSNSKYFLEFKYPVNLGYSFKKDKLKLTERPRVLKVREHALNFQELLINNKNYNVL